MRRTVTREEAFSDRYVRGPENECWLWTGQKNKGYGVFAYRGSVRYAHRVAYELFVGAIPEAHDLHHECQARACVNPAHLRPLSKVEHARQPTSETCKAGHPWTPESMSQRRGDGRRRCRICIELRERKPGGWKDPNRQRVTHCPRGHEYTPENTYVYANGTYRYCRTCNRAAARERHRRKRGG